MRPRTLLITTSGIEFAAGLALVLTPSLMTGLLLGEDLVAPASIVVGRVAGVALVALGAICWIARKSDGMSRRKDVIVGLLIYNTGIPVVLGHAAMVLRMRGIALWPAVLLHAALASWCLGCLRSHGAPLKHAGETGPKEGSRHR